MLEPLQLLASLLLMLDERGARRGRGGLLAVGKESWVWPLSLVELRLSAADVGPRLYRTG